MEGDFVEQKEREGHPSEWFEPKEVEFANGKLDIFDIKPDTFREEKDVPLVSILGFGTGNVALARTFSELQKSGEHVLGIDFVGGGKLVEGEDGTSMEFNRQGELLYQYLSKYLEENPHIDKIDFMTQSAGLFRVFALANLHPEFIPKIRNLLLFSPVGLSDKDSLLSMGLRFRSENKEYKNSEVKSEYDEENAQSLNMANQKLLSPHKLKAIMETMAIFGAGQYENLKKLSSSGVKIAIIQGEEDKLASNKKLWERLRKGYKRPFIKSEETTSGRKYEPDYKELPPVKVHRVMSGGKRVIGGETKVLRGGHGIQVDDPKKASRVILETIDTLNNPPKYPLKRDKDFNIIP